MTFTSLPQQCCTSTSKQATRLTELVSAATCSPTPIHSASKSSWSLLATVPALVQGEQHLTVRSAQPGMAAAAAGNVPAATRSSQAHTQCWCSGCTTPPTQPSVAIGRAAAGPAPRLTVHIEADG